MQPEWYRNAVFYSLDVALFADSDGDGVGDFRGLNQRLDHLRALGVTCVWLLPFYASPFRDGGYDVSDHLNVDPRLGDLGDVADLLDHADELGIRVIVDLVVQHTSDQHPWFRSARADRGSPYRDYYLWSDEPVDDGAEPVFPGVEDSVWEKEEQTGQYYRHTFYSHEPDLDVANPRVREEIRRIMGFWLRMGVSGFRVDAVPYLVQRAQTADRRRNGIWLLEEMAGFARRQRPDAVLLGEADVEIEEYADYFADGDGLTLMLDFWSNNSLWLALAEEDARPLRAALDRQPAPPRSCQYVNWVRNHDELDLEQLPKKGRRTVMERFAPDDDMRIYGRGIRRRTAPMLDGDPEWIALAFALAAMLPGSPALLYGDEIGMGDDLGRPERFSVRTPMQWDDGPSAGFSTAERLVVPVVGDGSFSFRDVNVAAQNATRHSLLNRIRGIVRARLQLDELGSPTRELLDVRRNDVLALRCVGEDSAVVLVANLGGEDVEISLPEDVAPDGRGLHDVVADRDYEALSGTTVPLAARGYRWLR